MFRQIGEHIPSIQVGKDKRAYFLTFFEIIVGIAIVLSAINFLTGYFTPEPEVQKPQYLEFHLPYYTLGNEATDRLSRLNLEVIQILGETKIPNTIRKGFFHYYPTVIKYAQIHNIDPFWALAIMWTESHFKWQAESHKGARGLMQIMPGTANYLSSEIRKIIYGPFKKSQFHDEWVPEDNIQLSLFYLNKLTKRFGDARLATIAYNVGPTKLRRVMGSTEAGQLIKRNNYLKKVTRRYFYLLNGYKSIYNSKEKSLEKSLGNSLARN